jgi:outer membrane protein OmpA-like peptidoglycan-associated protein
MISCRLIAFLLLSIIVAIPAFAQDNLRSQLFGETDAIMAQAKEKKADFYAPVSFGKAMKYYNEASEDYANGKKLEDIREEAKNASLYFAKALDQCKISEIGLRSTMIARTDAEKAGAQKSSLELWNKAEEQFTKAARQLEVGNLNSAKNISSEAETNYRTAELEAIKSNFLSPARELLKRANENDVKDNAPKTLLRAQSLATQAEALLKQNRYDTDSARELAQEARYEAAHAIYLDQLIRTLKQQDKKFEDVMVEAEVQFQRVAGGLGIRSRFDNGFDKPVGELLAAIKARDNKIMKDADTLRQVSDIVKQKENESENLKLQVVSMQTRLGSLTEAEKKLQDEGKALEQKLNLTYQQEATIRQVAAKFTEDEGNVIRDGDNIVLRLFGLSFPSGKNAIEAQYYPLLTKVQDAIRKFPNCKVTIEGHTDSQGSDEANQLLSEARAKAVAEYFMANMSVQIPMNSQGFGESRPIASNDTPEGRAKNRRIDIVITPGWAGK